MRFIFIALIILVLNSTSELFAQEKVTISGFISDQFTGELLIGANVIDSLSKKGTSTDNNEYFNLLITVPSKIIVSYMGYKNLVINCNSTHDTLLTIKMETGTELGEVIIRARQITKFNVATLNQLDFQQIPSVGGKPDVSKSLQLLPGIRSQNEGSSLLLVRGGDPGQNLYLFDNVPVIYVNHLGGFLSTFNPDIINNIDVYKGGFPSRYGGKLSSVVDITQKEGDKSGLKGSLGIGITDVSFSVEGPLKWKNSSFIVVGRKTLFGTLMALASRFSEGNDYIVRYGFHDINAKFTWKPNEKNSFNLDFYQGDDYLNYRTNPKKSVANEDYRMKDVWGNWLASLHWKTLLSPRLFVSNRLSYARYRLKNVMKYSINDGITPDYESKYFSSVQDLSFWSDIKYKIIEDWALEFGLQSSLFAHLPTESYFSNQAEQKKNEIDIKKPITWFEPQIFKNNGFLPESNGSKYNQYYLDTMAPCRFAFIAIGIMLENVLPGRAFIIAMETSFDDIEHTRQWLNAIFKESFDLPVYFDKIRLLDTLKTHYDDKKYLAGRMDILYMKQYKYNMIFALDNIGYKPTLEYYSNVLSDQWFGTFGFSDVLNAWIAATQNLEHALQLVSRSREILLVDIENEKSIKEANKYDFVYILKNLLSEYILWMPQQREFLKQFYNNEKELETGDEDLFGSIMRIGGYRIDICPIFATTDQLFETFMYHDPSKGKEYKQVIEDWIEKNKSKYDEAVDEMSKIEQKALPQLESFAKEENDIEKQGLELQMKIENYTKKYPKHEQFFIWIALICNPYYMDIDGEVEKFQADIWNLCQKDKENMLIRDKKERGEKISKIRYWLKEKRLQVHPDFELWIEDEQDIGVLTFLYLLVTLKIYHRGQAYARQQILLNRKYWDIWEKGNKYAVDNLLKY
jgi:hypothetical protein